MPVNLFDDTVLTARYNIALSLFFPSYGTKPNFRPVANLQCSLPQQGFFTAVYLLFSIFQRLDIHRCFLLCAIISQQICRVFFNSQNGSISKKSHRAEIESAAMTHGVILVAL